MIEIPEAVTLVRQLGEAPGGKRVRVTTAATAPHAFAWYHGDPATYADRLSGRAFGAARCHGGFVEVDVEDTRLLFAEGVALRALGPGDPRPRKHQLLVEFDDGTALAASVQMYGGLWAFAPGDFNNPCYDAARSKPSPLSEAFDRAHLDRLVGEPGVRGQSVKALLATEQRVPGLGNGVLQDILWEAGIHPSQPAHAWSALPPLRRADRAPSVPGGRGLHLPRLPAALTVPGGPLRGTAAMSAGRYHRGGTWPGRARPGGRRRSPPERM